MAQTYRVRECKAVLAQYLSTLPAIHKIAECSGRLLVLRPLDNSHALIDRLMQLFWNQHPAPFALHTQRQRHNCDFNIARLRKLKRLTNVVSIDQLRLHCFPDARSFESLARGLSVGCVIWISDRDAVDLRTQQV